MNLLATISVYYLSFCYTAAMVRVPTNQIVNQRKTKWFVGTRTKAVPVKIYYILKDTMGINTSAVGENTYQRR
jgi:hypothetical protein